MTRRAKVIVGAVVAGAGALLAAGYLTLISGPGERWFAARLAAAAADRGIDLEIEKLELAPFRLGLSADGLRAIPGGRGALRSLAAERVELAVSASSLLSGELRPTDLEIRGLEIEWDGERSEAGPVTIDLEPLESLQRVHVDGGVLRAGGRETRFDLLAEGIDVDLEREGERLVGTLEAGPLSFASEELHLEGQRLFARLRYRAPTLQIPELELSGPSGNLSASAAIRFDRDGVRVNGGAQGRADLEQILSDLGERALGGVAFRFSFEGRLPDGWELEGGIEAEGPLGLAGSRLDRLIAQVRADPSGVVVDHFEARTEAGSAVDRLEARATAQGWSLEAEGRLRIEELLERADIGRSMATGAAAYVLSLERSAERGWSWSAAAKLAPGTGSHPVAGEIEAEGDGRGGSLIWRGRWSGEPIASELRWTIRDGVPHWDLDAQLSPRSGRGSRSALEAGLGELSRQGIELPGVAIPELHGASQLVLEATGVARDVRDLELWADASSPRWSLAQFDRLTVRVSLGPGGQGPAVAARVARADGRGLILEARDGPLGTQFRARLDDVPTALAHHLLGALEGAPDLSAVAGLVDGYAAGRWGRAGPDLVFAASAQGWLPGSGQGRLSGSGSWVGERLELDAVSLDVPGIALEASGIVDLGPDADPFAFRGEVSVDARLERVLPHIGVGGVGGRLASRALVEFDGLDRFPSITGSAHWSGARARGRRVPEGDIHLSGSPEGTVARLESAALALEAAFSGAANEPRVAATLRWDDLDLISLFEAATGGPSEVFFAAWSDGELQLTGDLLDPKGWSGVGALETLEISGSDRTARLASIVPLRIEPPGRLVIDRSSPLVSVSPPGGRARLSGAVDVWGDAPGALELDLLGTIRLSALETLDADLVADGFIAGELEISGDVAEPHILGRASVRGGRAHHLGLGTTFDAIESELAFEGRRVRVESFRCAIGGGPLELSGTLELDGWQPDRMDLDAEARDVALSLSRGLWGRYDAVLSVGGDYDHPRVSGSVSVLSAVYSRAFEIEPSLGERVRTLDPQTPAGSFLANVLLDLDVTARESVAIRNEMALMESDLDLVVGGTLARPRLSGQLRLLEGGRFTFRDIDYDLLSGQVLLDDERGLPPRVRLNAATSVGDYAVRLELDASSDSLDYRLSSTPALPESAILMLLLTGQLTEDYRQIRSSQASSVDLGAVYFGSKLGELLLAGPARRALGITRFQIAPSSVGGSADPSARVTVGKRIDDRTLVLYSRDLSSEGEDYYRIERDLTRQWRFTVSREERGGVGADARWRRRFGPLAELGIGGSRVLRLGELEIVGLPDGLREPSRRRLGLPRTRRLTRAAVLAAKDQLSRILVDAGYLEARIDAELLERKRGSRRRTLRLSVDAGAPWDLNVPLRGRLARQVREALVGHWSVTSFRPQSVRAAERIVVDLLEDEGYTTAFVELDIDPADRTVDVVGDAGPRVRVASVELEGVRDLERAEVLSQVLLQPGNRLGFSFGQTTFRPRLLQEDINAILTLYRAQGFIGAAVEADVIYLADGSAVDLVLRVDEGPRARVGQLQIVGEWPAELGRVADRIGLASGDPYRPVLLETGEQALRDALDEAGYFEASVVAEQIPRGEEVDIVFRVRPGQNAVIDSVEIEGLERTRRRLVAQGLHLESGEPLRSRDLIQTEHDLFRIGTFSDVAIEHEPVAASEDGRRRVRVRLVEQDPYSIQTSFGWDTEEKLRGSVSLSNDNIGGMARVGTLQLFGSSLQRGLRMTLEDTNLMKGRLEGLLTSSWTEEERDGFTLDRVSAAVEVGLPLRNRRRWQFRYALSDDRFEDVVLDPEALEEALREESGRLEEVRLGSATVFWTADRRDDLFLPSRGNVIRTDVGLWAPWLASERSFLRWNGQVTGYYPLREDIVLVSSLRLGAAWTYSDTESVPLSERYFAGGSTTLRGFDRDGVGPLDAPGGNPIGGEARALLNLEARIRVFEGGWIVLFSDAGNVWISPRDVDLSDLRSSAGLGFRYDTPVGALRLEYGFKLDREEGESSGRLHISIGESF